MALQGDYDFSGVLGPPAKKSQVFDAGETQGNNSYQADT